MNWKHSHLIWPWRVQNSMNPTQILYITHNLLYLGVGNSKPLKNLSWSPYGPPKPGGSNAPLPPPVKGGLNRLTSIISDIVKITSNPEIYTRKKLKHVIWQTYLALFNLADYLRFKDQILNFIKSIFQNFELQIRV